MINLPHPDPRPFTKEWAAWTRDKSVNDLQADYPSFAAGCEAHWYDMVHALAYSGPDKNWPALENWALGLRNGRQDLRNENADLKAQLEAMRGRADEPWSDKPPTEQDWYFHWNGNPDCGVLPISVLYSGFTGKCFVSMGQLGIDHAIDCEEYGGWWQRIIFPAVNTLKAWREGGGT